MTVQSKYASVCQYNGKACSNLRATKNDGKLHKLCPIHRTKAKLYQQKSVKRRQERVLLYDMAQLAVLHRSQWPEPSAYQALHNCATDDFERVALEELERRHNAGAETILSDASGWSQLSESDGTDDDEELLAWVLQVLENMSPEEFNSYA